MPQTAIVEGQLIHDWLIRYYSNEYCFEVVTFRNPTAGVLSFKNGLVTEISAGKHIPVAVAANAAGVLLQDITNLGATTDTTALVLKRGPALVNEDRLIINGLVLATIMTALAALTPPILAYKEPIKKTVMAS